jgi:hypothetical protein
MRKTSFGHRDFKKRTAAASQWNIITPKNSHLADVVLANVQIKRR